MFGRRHKANVEDRSWEQVRDALVRAMDGSPLRMPLRPKAEPPKKWLVVFTSGGTKIVKAHHYEKRGRRHVLFLRWERDCVLTLRTAPLCPPRLEWRETYGADKSVAEFWDVARIERIK